MSAVGEVGVAVCGAVMLAWLVNDLVLTRATLSRSGWLVLLAALAGVGPTLIGQCTGAETTRTDSFGDTITIQAGWLSGLSKALLLAALLIAAWRVFVAVSSAIPPHNPAALLLGAVVALAVVADKLHGRGGAEWRSLCLALLLLAAAWCRPDKDVARAGALVVTVTGVASAAISVLEPAAAWGDCRTDKCSVFGSLLSGALNSENALGLLVAVGLPAVWLASAGRWRWMLTASCLFLVVATGSRTALLAAAAATVAVATAPGSGDQRGERSAPAVIAALGVMFAVAVPLRPLAEQSYSTRGALWSLARDGIAGSPLLGHGAAGWQALYESTGRIATVSTYSAHNQWLDVTYSVGAIGVSLFIAGVAMSLTRLDRSSLVARTLLLVPVAWAGALERPWSLDALDWLSWDLLVVCLALAPTISTKLPTARGHGELLPKKRPIGGATRV